MTQIQMLSHRVLNDIPIKRTPKKKTTKEMKMRNNDRMKISKQKDPVYKAAQQLLNREWHSIPENKIKKNIRYRLRRYKIKLNNKLPIIWAHKGLIKC